MSAKYRTQKSVVFEVMPQAIIDAGSQGGQRVPFSARDLWYKTRTRYKAHPEMPPKYPELSMHYFGTRLLEQYQAEHGTIEGLIREPAGHLQEPHDGEYLELGTLEVAAYDFPEYAFDKILYVEKHAELPKLKHARIGERYDMALVAGRGYATDAIRDLFVKAGEGEYKLFVVHDADPDGYGIARALREETRRMPKLEVEVIDLGLTIADAEELGAEGEAFTRNKSLDAWLEPRLTPRERGRFVGQHLEGKRFECWRYELTSLSNDQRMAYIEAKLEEHGATGKVIPPDDHLEDIAERFARAIIRNVTDQALEAAIEETGFHDRVYERFAERFAEVSDDPRPHVANGLEADPYKSWRQVLGRAIASKGAGVPAEIREMVRELLENVGDEEREE